MAERDVALGRVQAGVRAMTAFTDDDVTAVAGEFCLDEVSAPCDTCLLLARHALRDVAPAIAARALREAADDWHKHWPMHPLKPSDATYLIDWLRARADRLDGAE